MALTRQEKTPIWAYLLFDVIEELHASKADALERLTYDTNLRLDDPDYRAEAARFWRDLRRKLSMFGPLPKRVREELDLLCGVQP